ncbi:hypothetical protein [Rhizobium sp. WSM1325]|uniref:hypothetical protein n=1 Tax=Rhizobium sp. WSM1325 TaxID=3444086 RepID=UPI001FE0A324|nr:hypothetical protein [Rhizobium leguminosarum]
MSSRTNIALSGAVHRLFDMHLISLTDDYRILVLHKVPSELKTLFETDGLDPLAWEREAVVASGVCGEA